MNTSEQLGIVGLDSLGSKLRMQAEAHGISTIGFSVWPPEVAESAIDDAVDISVVPSEPVLVGSLEQLVSEVSTVHWCARAETSLGSLKALPKSKTLVLHNSTMAESVRVRETLLERPSILGDIAIVHCLMNEEANVAVANDFGKVDKIVNDFSKLGLNHKIIGYQEHDYIMAHSQGIFALLIEMGMGDWLKEWGYEGMLVRSSREAQAALTHRESKWTKPTIKSILDNEHIVEFAEKILATAKAAQISKYDSKGE